MRNYIFIFLVLFLTASCKKKTVEQIPDDVISQDTISMILAEMHLAESLSNFRGMMDTQSQEKTDENYILIFTKYKTTSNKFYSSYGYYLEKPERMDRVYSDVLEHLSKVQAELQSKKEN